MEGWVNLGYPPMYRPGVELTIESPTSEPLHYRATQKSIRTFNLLTCNFLPGLLFPAAEQQLKNIGRRAETATLTSRTNISPSSWKTTSNWSQFGRRIPAGRCSLENWRSSWLPSCRNWWRNTRSDARTLPTMSCRNIWNRGNWILVFDSRLLVYARRCLHWFFIYACWLFWTDHKCNKTYDKT